MRARHAALRPRAGQPHLQAGRVGGRRGAARRVAGGAHVSRNPNPNPNQLTLTLTLTLTS